MSTAGTDYYGTKDAGDGLARPVARIGIVELGGSGLSLIAGRQDLQVGDGFVIGDGYHDTQGRAVEHPAQLLRRLRADWAQGPWHALAFGARLSPSYGRPRA